MFVLVVAVVRNIWQFVCERYIGNIFNLISVLHYIMDFVLLGFLIWLSVEKQKSV